MFRPPEGVVPLTWTGEVTDLDKPDKPKDKGKGEGPRREGHGRQGRQGRRGRPVTLTHGLTLGSVEVDTPVVLAPMAGITNAAYRRLCAEQGAGLYVCEMITSPRPGRARRARR